MVHRKDKLILFVHGLGGDGRKTWRRRSRPGFQQLIETDPAIDNLYETAFFDYPTTTWRLPLMKRSLAIDELARALRTQIETYHSRYEQVVLCCHSLGGLIARQYLLEEVSNHRPLKVKLLMLYAVPNSGSGLASVANRVSWRHAHLKQLAKNSAFIEQLNNRWGDLGMEEQLEVRFVIAGQDRAVDRASAVTEVGEERVDVDADANHRTIVKPRTHLDPSYALLRKAVLGPYESFLSVAGGRSSAQDIFLTNLREFASSFNIHAAGVDEYSSTNKSPLKDVEARMDHCYGAVVVAFERLRVEKGLSRPDTSQDRIDGNRYATVWNQIEAAMAYTRGLPILVLVEEGVMPEGLLDSRYDWRVKSISTDMDLANDPEFIGMFRDWRSDVVLARDSAIGLK